jgi:hypothetical protein
VAVLHTGIMTIQKPIPGFFSPPSIAFDRPWLRTLRLPCAAASRRVNANDLRKSRIQDAHDDVRIVVGVDPHQSTLLPPNKECCRKREIRAHVV